MEFWAHALKVSTLVEFLMFGCSFVLRECGISKGVGILRVDVSCNFGFFVYMSRHRCRFSSSSCFTMGGRWIMLKNWVHWVLKMRIWWWWSLMLHPGVLSNDSFFHYIIGKILCLLFIFWLVLVVHLRG